jgi:hypothetical protein
LIFSKFRLGKPNASSISPIANCLHK